MADRQEWDHATAFSRRLAIAADAELRRRHPDRKIEALGLRPRHPLVLRSDLPGISNYYPVYQIQALFSQRTDGCA
jgi:hypothetical protein